MLTPQLSVARSAVDVRALFLSIALIVAAIAIALSPEEAAAATQCQPPVGGAPTINIAKTQPGEVLYGDPIPVTLTANEPSGETYGGFNLSFRDVLPVGVHYVPGSGSPAPTVIADAPTAGQTTLIWSNVADLAPNSSYSVSYQVTYDTSGPDGFFAGDTLTTGTVTGTAAAGAYVNCNPRQEPRFDSTTGQPIGNFTNSYSGSATTAPSSTELKAIQIEKSEPSPEGELLRGVHDHQTVYTLTVNNNQISPTDGLVIEDYIPAGLEFLGCGGPDNTTNAPTNTGSPFEYPGSGPIPSNPVSGCIAPDIVETVSNDLAAPSLGTYTHVVWNLTPPNNALAPGASLTLKYGAAIPICPNTTTWSNGEPADDGPQGSNLDNNACGAELNDEAGLTNRAGVTGDYHGTNGGQVSDSDSHTVTAEDLSIQKTVSSPTLAVGALTTWTLHVRTSEYRYFTGLTVTDTLPNAYCPIDGTTNNYEHTPPPADPECDGTGSASDDPTIDGVQTNFAASDASAVENADGTWTVNFDVPDSAAQSNADFDVKFKSKTRKYYQANYQDTTPVLAGDSTSNSVHTQGTANVICSTPLNSPVDCSDPLAGPIFHTRPDPEPLVDDDSIVAQSGGEPTLSKQGRVPGLTNPVNCGTGTYSSGTVGVYRVGDIVCWKLRVDFPANLSTGGISLTDFLPPGTEYVNPGPPGSGATPNNEFPNVVANASGRLVDFELNEPTPYAGSDQVFEWIIATKITNQDAGNPDPDAVFAPIRGNLLKLTSENTEGVATTSRDVANFEATAPVLSVTKGVKSIDNPAAGPFGPDHDGGSIDGDSTVTYRADVTNETSIDTVDGVVSERLVGPYDCDMISNITTPGGSSATCTDDPTPGPTSLTIIKWTGLAVDANSSVELNWDFKPGSVIVPGVVIPDNVCVDSYDNETNDPDDPTFTWAPENPTDICGPNATGQRAAEATDDSFVTARGTLTKTATTSVDETNNNASGQATIGETITYAVTLQVPHGTSIPSPEAGVQQLNINDTIQTPAQQVYVAGSAGCSSTTVPDICGTATVSGSASAVSLQWNGAYTNSTASDQAITLTYQVKVADVPANISGATLANQATATYRDQYDQLTSRNTNATNVTIVEPNPTITKSDDDTDNIVSPGQEIQYSVNISNPNRGSGPASSPLHETTVTDLVPVGLTPTDGSGTPLADGAAVVLCNGGASTPTGTWSSGTRTITWTIGTLAPGATITNLRYCAEVDSSPAPSAGQTLVNTATIAGTSMAGTVAGERPYSKQATDTMTVAGSTITKTANPTSAPVGKHVQYTVNVTLPANTQFYDYRVTDTLPAGMGFVSFDSATCATACGIGAPTSTQVGQNLTWSYGAIASSASARTLTITYTAVVTDVSGNQSGTILNNSARQAWCIVATTPCPGGSAVSPPAVNATVTVTEPNLTINKDVNCQTADNDTCNVQPGSSFSYSITVANTGNTTAYDALIQDQVPSSLVNVVVGALPGGVTTATPTGSNTHAWNIASLAPNASVTITYTADLAASANLTNLQHVINMAEVSSYWGLPAAERAGNPQARPYPEGAKPTDAVDLTVFLPQPTVVKTVANSGNAEINQPLRWTLTVGNSSTVAQLNDIDVTDLLPTGWNYVAGSTLRNAVAYADPSITGQTLKWTNIGDIAGGGSPIVISFEATPTMAALVGGNPTNPYTNNVSILGADNSGATGHGTPNTPYSASDSEDANIQMPNLTIAKTPNNATVHAGTWNNWTIVVTNTGPATARNVEIRDAVPADLFYNVATHPATVVCVPGPCDNPTGPLNVGNTPVTSGTGPHSIHWTLDSLAPNQSVTITLPMYVQANVASGTVYTNNAYTHSTERPTEITDPGEWTTDRSADLAITKVGTPNPGTAGENITYTLTATNNGPSTANGVQVHDTIDTDQFEFVSVTPTNGTDSCTTSGTPDIDQIDCDVNSELGVGATRSFTVVLKVKSGLVDPVSNTATVDGDEPDPDPDNNTDTEVIPLGTVADLTITKDVSSGKPSTIYNANETEFTITVHNNGPSDALSTTVEDELPDGLSCVSTTPASTGCPSAAGGTVSWNLGTVEANGTVVLKMVVRGEEVGEDWDNVATVSSPTDPTDSSDDAEVTVLPMADLGVTKTGPATAASGSTIAYTVTVTNHGPDTAENAELTDTLPAGTMFVSAISVPTGPTCGAVSGGAFSCDLGDMASGDEFVFTVTINVGFGHSESTITNLADVESDTTDTDPSNDHDEADTDIGPNADVAIVKSGPAYGAEGYPMTYTLAVVNNGPATAEDVEVTDPLPAGLTYQSYTASVGSCAESNGTVTCQLGDMDPGDTAQITVTVVPDASVVGTTVHNVATATSPTPDPNTSNNTDDADTPIENHAYPTSSDVTITKTASNANPSVGDIVTFSIVATNKGPDTARGVVVTDTLPAGLIYVSASAQGSCTFKAPLLTCQL
ncbi:MAG: isopeptide-forming domain-containing fimbrial protein [Solirubrobacterales bacterium]